MAAGTKEGGATQLSEQRAIGTFTSASSTKPNIETPEYVSYSGVDIKAVIHIPPDFIHPDYINKDQLPAQGEYVPAGSDNYMNKSYSKPVILADIQTLSYSIYREKYPVRSLGMAYPKGFTRGPRTISGSMIFTMFDQTILHDFMSRIQPDTTSDISNVLIDQLPRFDITITFANEYGSASTMGIHGVELISEGATMSIEDLLTENVVEYMAQDFTPMRKAGSVMERIGNPPGKTGTDILWEIHGGKQNYETNK